VQMLSQLSGIRDKQASKRTQTYENQHPQIHRLTPQQPRSSHWWQDHENNNSVQRRREHSERNRERGADCDHFH
jgi:hypothetical protein